MAFISSEMWILVIVATLVGVFYWFSKEEKKYREREFLFQQSSSTGFLNKPRHSNIPQNNIPEPSRTKEHHNDFIRESRVRNEERNSFQSSNNFSNVTRTNYHRSSYDKPYSYQIQEGVFNRNDLRLTQSQYINTRQNREYGQSDYIVDDNSNRQSYATQNLYSQNQTQAAQLLDNSESGRKKNPYLEPHQKDERFHTEPVPEREIYPEIEKIVKGSDQNDSAMQMEHSPNSQDYNPRIGKNSLQQARKPTKKEDDILGVSPSKKDIQPQKDKNKSSGQIKSSKYQDDDDEGDDDFRFVKKEGIKRNPNNEQLKERGEKEKFRNEILEPINREIAYEYRGNNSLKKYMQNINLKDYHFAELYNEENIEKIIKKIPTSAKTQTISTQPAQSSGLNLTDSKTNTTTTDKPSTSGGLFGNNTSSTTISKPATEVTKPSSGNSTGGGLFANGTSLGSKPATEQDKKPSNAPSVGGSGLFGNKPADPKPADNQTAETKATDLKLPESKAPENKAADGQHQQSDSKPAEQKTNFLANLSSQTSTDTKTSTPNPQSIGGLFGNGNKLAPSNSSALQGGLFGNNSASNSAPNITSTPGQSVSFLNKPPAQDTSSQPKPDENGNKPTENKAPTQTIFSTSPANNGGGADSKPPIMNSSNNSSSKPSGGLFGGSSTQNGNTSSNLFEKSSETTQNISQSSAKLFGSITADAANTKVGSLTTQQNTDTEKKTDAISSQIPSLGRKDAMDPSTSALSNPNVGTTETKPTDGNKGGGLFGSNNKPTGSLFSFSTNSSNNSSNSAANQNSSTIFGTTGSNPADKPLTGIFANQSGSNGNLFGKK